MALHAHSGSVITQIQLLAPVGPRKKAQINRQLRKLG